MVAIGKRSDGDLFFQGGPSLLAHFPTSCAFCAKADISLSLSWERLISRRRTRINNGENNDSSYVACRHSSRLPLIPSSFVFAFSAQSSHS